MSFNQDFIKANPNKKLFITHVGGGDLLLNDIKSDFNASEFLIGSESPYSTEHIDDILGYKPKQYCTEEIARKFAIYSFQKAIKYTDDIENCIGIGLTCIVQKENERDRRLHKVYICKHEFNKTTMFVCDDFYEYLEFVERLSERSIRLCEIGQIKYILWVLLVNQIDLNDKCWKNSQTITRKYFDIDNNCKNMLVFPGSFNPFHQGHQDCIDIAQQIFQNYQLFLELSSHNRDKGFVDYFELYNRVKNNNYNYLLSNAKTFVDKVKFIKEINPEVGNIIFMIGEDTLDRIIHDDCNKRWRDLQFFKDNNIKFIVFNRESDEDYLHNLMKSNHFGLDEVTAIDNPFMEYLNGLCIKHELLDTFSSNYSSTEIRKTIEMSE